MKKIACVLFLVLCAALVFGAELKARDIVKNAELKSNVDDSVAYLKSEIDKIDSASEKRAVLIFLASLQEQMSMFDEAQRSYVQAAGIAAGDAEDMPKRSNEQLVIDAVRCALSCGDFATADSYLNSAVRNSKNERIQSYVKLYAQWSALCRAEDIAELQEPIAILQAYSRVETMKSVQPVVLLTLWHVTGDNSYSKEILLKFPKSTEASIVNGDIQLLPTPFWFFVPKSGVAEQGIGTFNETLSQAQNEQPETVEVSSEKNQSEKVNSAIVRLQLGLFKTESNAKLLADEVKAKGFDAYIISETRSSGTTYYLVLVNEDKNNSIADKLRSSGYECYSID